MSLLNTDILKIALQNNILVNNNEYSLINQLYPGLQDVEFEMVYILSLPYTLS